MHGKKMAAPIIISILLILYYVGFAYVCLFADVFPFWIKLLFGGVPLLLAGVCVSVLIERIQEIRSGEEDDLSKY